MRFAFSLHFLIQNGVDDVQSDRTKAQLLSQMGVVEKDVICELLCDRSVEGGFRDTLLVLTAKGLFIACSRKELEGEKIFRGFPLKKNKRFRSLAMVTPGAGSSSEPEAAATADDWSTEHIPLGDIESLSIVNLVASGLLVVKTKEERAIAAFTNGLMSRASLLSKLFDKVKKGEEIEPELLEKNEAEENCPACGMIYPEPERRICPKCMKKSAIFARLLKFAVPYKKTVAIVIFLMLLNAVCALAIPYLTGTVLFDQALAGKGAFAGQIGLVVGLIILFRTLSLLFGILYGYLNAKMAISVVFDLKSAVFTAMQRLSLSFFQRRQTGHLMTRINNDSTELQYFFIDGLSYFIVNLMNIIGITVILLMLDWKLTLLCFLPLPLVILLVQKAFPKLWRLSWRSHRRVSALNSMISDSIKGTRVVKAFGMEKK